jgi:hypothetical protein
MNLSDTAQRANASVLVEIAVSNAKTFSHRLTPGANRGLYVSRLLESPMVF